MVLGGGEATLIVFTTCCISSNIFHALLITLVVHHGIKSLFVYILYVLSVTCISLQPLLKATSCTDRLHVMDPVGYLRLDFPPLRSNTGIMSWLVKGRRSPLRTTLTAISLTTGCFGFACVMNRYTESRSYVVLLHYSSYVKYNWMVPSAIPLCLTRWFSWLT